MKYLATFAFVLFGTFGVFAGEINFQTGTWEELQAKAKKENKYLFVDAMTDWCYWCKVMDKKTFPDQEVVDLMNKNFVAASIDMEKGYGITLSMKYRVLGFPTFLIFSPDGKLVYRMSGYHEVPAFLAELNKALTPATQQSYPGITANMNPAYPDFYRQSYADKRKRITPDDATIAAFYRSHTDWTDEVAFGVMLRFSTPTNVNQYFLHNIARYRELYGDEPNDKVLKLISEKKNIAAKNKNRNELEEAFVMIDKYISGDQSEMKQTLTLEYYSQTGEWPAFRESFQKYLDEHGYDSNLINEYSWNIYEECNDATVIAQACIWMKAVTEKDAQYAFLDTYAALLYKNKQYPEAGNVAKQAIEAGRKINEDVKPTEELLEKIQKVSGN